MSRAIIPGSFDPMTLGHKQVIAAAAEIFDEVVVLVMHNDMTKYVKDAKVKGEVALVIAGSNPKFARPAEQQ
jgi:pantetheine-phosphate adenylyltransferase